MVLKNNYDYKGLDYLETSLDVLDCYIDDIKNGYSDTTIHLCMYEIVESEYKPFLKFLLEKNAYNELQFLIMNPFQIYMNKKPFMEFVKDYIKVLLHINYISNEINYDYKGMVKNGNQLYLFIDISYMKLELNDVYKENNLWFTLIHEIIHTKRLCDINVQEETSLFFEYYPNFLFIEDQKKEIVEIPMVAYIGQPEKKLEFTYTFGVSKSFEMMGYYYYFTNYENAIQQIKDQMQGETKEKIGIVRSAIFKGKMLLKVNDINDSIDESEIKKKRCTELEYNHKYEALTMRISDYDGKWTEDYDSVYLGQIELDDGTFLNNTPLYVIKEFKQQHSLSYHFIDKNGNTIL